MQGSRQRSLLARTTVRLPVVQIRKVRRIIYHEYCNPFPPLSLSLSYSTTFPLTCVCLYVGGEARGGREGGEEEREYEDEDNDEEKTEKKKRKKRKKEKEEEIKK